MRTSTVAQTVGVTAMSENPLGCWPVDTDGLGVPTFSPSTSSPSWSLAIDKCGVVLEEPSEPAPKIAKTHTTLFVSVAKIRADEARSLIAKVLTRVGIDNNLV
jgi:hypothetical protein